jgi:Type I phosphodiesterase / nucleotide pyrophosphatase
VRKRIVFGFSLLLSAAVFAASAERQKGGAEKEVRHVLLISVDGLHALDVAKYTASHPHLALAELASHGVTYSGANTPQNSDSFPGLLALVTGGSPVTSGLLYDVSYDRTIFDPTNTTCTGTAGNMMVFDESIDKYDVQNASLNVIDPAQAASAPQPKRQLRSFVASPSTADEYDLRSGSGVRWTHRLGRQASCLRPGKWAFRVRRRGSLHSGSHKCRGTRQYDIAWFAPFRMINSRSTASSMKFTV